MRSASFHIEEYCKTRHSTQRHRSSLNEIENRHANKGNALSTLRKATVSGSRHLDIYAVVSCANGEYC